MINNEKFKTIGIIGNPLRQSLSPYLHNYWINKYKINSYYVPLPIKKVNNLNKALKALNFLGLNVTIPFKKEIIKELDVIDSSAKEINAVNTLVFKNNKIKGYNTDIVGFREGLKNNAWDKNKPVYLFGAGGAADAILQYLKKEKIKNITIINRTKSRAKAISKKYENINFSTRLDNKIKEAGLIINSTSLGMIGYPDLKIDLKGINKKAIVYDIVYNPINTKLILEAKKQKLTTVTGLEMFIEQARASFKIWFNINPQIDNKLILEIKRKIKKT